MFNILKHLRKNSRDSKHQDNVDDAGINEDNEEFETVDNPLNKSILQEENLLPELASKMDFLQKQAIGTDQYYRGDPTEFHRPKPTEIRGIVPGSTPEPYSPRSPEYSIIKTANVRSPRSPEYSIIKTVNVHHTLDQDHEINPASYPPLPDTTRTPATTPIYSANAPWHVLDAARKFNLEMSPGQFDFSIQNRPRNYSWDGIRPEKINSQRKTGSSLKTTKRLGAILGDKDRKYVDTILLTPLPKQHQAISLIDALSLSPRPKGVKIRKGFETGEGTREGLLSPLKGKYNSINKRGSKKIDDNDFENQRDSNENILINEDKQLLTVATKKSSVTFSDHQHGARKLTEEEVEVFELNPESSHGELIKRSSGRISSSSSRKRKQVNEVEVVRKAANSSHYSKIQVKENIKMRTGDVDSSVHMTVDSTSDEQYSYVNGSNPFLLTPTKKDRSTSAEWDDGNYSKDVTSLLSGEMLFDEFDDMSIPTQTPLEPFTPLTNETEYMKITKESFDNFNLDKEQEVPDEQVEQEEEQEEDKSTKVEDKIEDIEGFETESPDLADALKVAIGCNSDRLQVTQSALVASTIIIVFVGFIEHFVYDDTPAVIATMNILSTILIFTVLTIIGNISELSTDDNFLTKFSRVVEYFFGLRTLLSRCLFHAWLGYLWSQEGQKGTIVATLLFLCSVFESIINMIERRSMVVLCFDKDIRPPEPSVTTSSSST